LVEQLPGFSFLLTIGQQVEMGLLGYRDCSNGNGGSRAVVEAGPAVAAALPLPESTPVPVSKGPAVAAVVQVTRRGTRPVLPPVLLKITLWPLWLL